MARSAAMQAPQWLRLIRYSGSEPDRLSTVDRRTANGERQRFALLRAIEQRPLFLLLDEPTTALDHTSTLQVESLIGELIEEKIGIRIVSNAVDQMQRFSKAVLTVEIGQ
jgi:ABC-type phosphate transport system ATPase subunit